MRAFTVSLFALAFAACGTAPAETSIATEISARDANDVVRPSSLGKDIGATDCTVVNVNGWLVDYYVGPVESGGWLALIEFSDSGSNNSYQRSIPASDSSGPNGEMAVTLQGVNYDATYTPGTNGQRIGTLTITYGNGESVVVSPGSPANGYCEARLFYNVNP